MSELIQEFIDQEVVCDSAAKISYDDLRAEFRSWLRVTYTLRPDPELRHQLKQELIRRSGGRYSVDNDQLIGVRLKTNDERADEEEEIRTLFDTDFD